MRMKRAVLVGCLYRYTPHELHGCINDVSCMKSLLIGPRFDFSEQNIKVLTDDTKPTPIRENIMNALNLMVDKARPGDVLFFFFSGYGTSLGNQQAIVPLDALDGSNLITSYDLQTLVSKLPSGATLTIVADSGHSGRLIHEKPQQIRTSSSKIESHNIPVIQMTSKSFPPIPFKSACTIQPPLGGAIGTKSDGGILLSACQPDETAFEGVAAPIPAVALGAFTGAIKVVLDEHPEPITNKELVTYASAVLKTGRVDQHPGLYCRDENANAIFLLQSENKLH